MSHRSSIFVCLSIWDNGESVADEHWVLSEGTEGYSTYICEGYPTEKLRSLDTKEHCVGSIIEGNKRWP